MIQEGREPTRGAVCPALFGASRVTRVLASGKIGRLGAPYRDLPCGLLGWRRKCAFHKAASAMTLRAMRERRRAREHDSADSALEGVGGGESTADRKRQLVLTKVDAMPPQSAAHSYGWWQFSGPGGGFSRGLARRNNYPSATACSPARIQISPGGPSDGTSPEGHRGSASCQRRTRPAVSPDM
jgi:hypothetical protein